MQGCQAPFKFTRRVAEPEMFDQQWFAFGGRLDQVSPQFFKLCLSYRSDVMFAPEVRCVNRRFPDRGFEFRV